MVVKRFAPLIFIVLGLLCLLTLLGDSLFPRAEIGAIHLYQKVGSPVMGYFVTCRFTPSCTHYAVRVLSDEGFWKGNLLIFQRLIRCSPVGALLLD